MNSNKENTIKKDDHSQTTTKNKPQESRRDDTKHADTKPLDTPRDDKSKRSDEQKKAEFNTDATQRSSGVSPPKYNKHNPSDNRDNKDVDAERHPEEQVIDPSEFTKKDTQYFNDKSDRV